ncbi:outer surface protein (OMPA-like) heat-resistant agglutinin 1 [Bradyrhizobium sp. AS23.2]|nr:outer surface protein (OMPA-like) heat-resistant agglutinin 1 [Bradyrhizobium sp. AS23.2]
MPIAPPPMYAPAPPVDFGGWYLRGDIGFSNQRTTDVHYGRESAYSQLTSFNQQSSFDTGGIFGVGAGYRFNNWFRADVTGQFRGNANLKATDRFTGTAGGVAYNGIDNYTGSKSEWLVLANAYVDLGTWWCITPFIGAGIGGARVSIANFTDTGTNNLPFTTTGFASAPTGSKWNFAWAAHAGLAYQVNQNLVLELAYSYVNLGNGQTGVLSDFTGNTTGNVFKIKNITSNDLKFGLRWNLDSPPVYAPPPLVTKG